MAKTTKDLALILDTIMDGDLKKIHKDNPGIDVQLLLAVQTVRSTNKMINGFKTITN